MIIAHLARVVKREYAVTQWARVPALVARVRRGAWKAEGRGGVSGQVVAIGSNGSVVGAADEREGEVA